jgi:hypothetical protein
MDMGVNICYTLKFLTLTYAMLKIVGIVVVFFQNPCFVNLCAITSLLSGSSYYVKVLSKFPSHQSNCEAT